MDILVSLYIETNDINKGVKFISSCKDSFEKNIALFLLTKHSNPDASSLYFQSACNHDPNNKTLLINLLPLYNKINNQSKNYLGIYENLSSKHKKSLIVTILATNYMVKKNKYNKAKDILKKNIPNIKQIDTELYPTLLYTLVCAGCKEDFIEKVFPQKNINQIIFDSNISELNGNSQIKIATIKSIYKKLKIKNKKLKNVICHNI